MDTKISILFYGRKAKTTRDNPLPIYLRVTIQGRRLELSAHRYVSPDLWSAEAAK
ncbi:Arm DNA-binding domain-containing protein [Pontibacter ramchanderi]|uniref:Integrase-like protein n=1 Tax=Pontibacter ramchanderi TaxID=1179743 RepID=A0A2N3U9X4_9BACT|nr:Arm DNA-binding domain-containing protein [Pontibacter ramchanderi]PKV63540.1 integrase-like protein [Pontibacter ramchanderi]